MRRMNGILTISLTWNPDPDNPTARLIHRKTQISERTLRFSVFTPFEVAVRFLRDYFLDFWKMVEDVRKK
jgi:hypothetical protein